jgi:hypothetical protein
MTCKEPPQKREGRCHVNDQLNDTNHLQARTVGIYLGLGRVSAGPPKELDLK